MGHTPQLTPEDDVIGDVSARLPNDLAYYDERYLRRRITARMRRTYVDNFDEYLQYIENDRTERIALMESLSINVTGFFRNPGMWERFQQILRKRTRESGQVNVWSAPCADGREPYSIALLALDDSRIDADHLRIVGTDVSEEALATARIGEYRTGTTNDIASELAPLRHPDRYVSHEEGIFRLGEPVKDLVEFRQHDLIHDEPLTGMDIVFCRNLLIYIHPEYEHDVFATVSSALDTGGILIVGMTESSAPERAESFEALDRRNRIYKKR